MSTDNEMRLQYTDVGQNQWSNWEAQPIGEVGEYGLPLVWTRQGRAMARVYTFECSSPRKRDVLSVVAIIEGAR